MSINSDGKCVSCGRDFQGELAEGSECPETDDCPSHVEEKGFVWWAYQDSIKTKTIVIDKGPSYPWPLNRDPN